MEELLEELKRRLCEAAGNNLKAIVLYGSAVSGSHHKEHSDLNLLCVLERAGASDLEALHEPTAWWRRKGYAAPHVFTLPELHSSADIFAIELLDMKAQHRMIYGEDFFAQLEIPTCLLRGQIERELRTNAVRLRQAILTVPPRDRVIVDLMDASISAFVTLFRHALCAMGEQTPADKRGVIERAAAACGANAEAFLAILDVHEGKRKSSVLEAQSTLEGYVDLVERMNDLVDRRLASA